MRVISGIARGRKLATPEGLDVRPTSDRVKEGVFSAIQFEISGKRVLDLFAGSGQLGIEALSRGASEAIFVDLNPKSIEFIKKNLAATGFSKNSIVKNTDYRSFLASNNRTMDIVLLDPPYEKGYLNDVLPLVEPFVSSDGVIICESGRKEVLPEEVGDFAVSKVYNYGNIKITMYRKKKTDAQ